MRFGLLFWILSAFGFIWFRFVSFDIRISDLFRYSEQFFVVILNEVKDLFLVSEAKQILRSIAPQNDIQPQITLSNGD
jgi:hypothetical protein